MNMKLLLFVGFLFMMNQQVNAECCYSGNCPINEEWDMWQNQCISCPCADGCPCLNPEGKMKR